MKNSSWKTTLGGIGGLLVAIGALGSIAVSYANGEPISIMQAMAALGGISTAITGLSARDNDVTSEDAGAR